MKHARLLIAATALAVSVAPLSAQVTAPNLFGFQRLALPGNSDTIVSLPFARPEAAAGLVQTVDGAQITFQTTPVWTENRFVANGTTQPDTFYVLVQSGTKEGSTYVVTANGTDTVTVDLDGDSLDTLNTGDRLAIIPFWTLSSLFPEGAGIHASATVGNRQTEVLFPDFNASGTNTSPGSVFFYYNSHWLKVGGGITPHDNDTILPDAFFTVRHNVAGNTELACSGQVLSGKLKTVLGVSTTGKRDNFLGLQRPVAVTLADSGLLSSGAFAASPTVGNRTDELLVFDNLTAGKNKSPSAVYFYWNNAWRRVGAGTATFDTTAYLTPGDGFLIRKNAAATAPSWTNSPNY